MTHFAELKNTDLWGDGVLEGGGISISAVGGEGLRRNTALVSNNRSRNGKLVITDLIFV
jgi:hypothetical protein